jgi:hypothetical protein
VPMLVVTPDLLIFSRTPGNSLIRLWKRKPMLAPLL